jgi:hypothetical protein
MDYGTHDGQGQMQLDGGPGGANLVDQQAVQQKVSYVCGCK